MSNVGRLVLNHPALGTAGGSGLHATIEAIYKKIGDNISTRIIAYTGLANSATATLEHDLKAAFTNYRYDLYLLSGSDPYDLTRVTASTTPSLSDFTIVANGTNPTTQIDITNNSGASRDIALVLIMDPLYLSEGDVKDIDVTSIAPFNGAALIYNSGASKWEPGTPAAGIPAANIRSSEGAGTTTLTITDAMVQVFNLSAGRNVKLPTTSVTAGLPYTMVNPNAFVLTIQASDGSTILKSWGSSATLVPKTNTPTTNTDWEVIDHKILYGRTWASWTPTFTNLGTVTDIATYWMRTGINTMALHGTFQMGSNSSGSQGYFSLPISLTMDTGIVTSLQSGFGTWHQKTTSGIVNIFNSTYSGVCFYDGGISNQVLAFAANTANLTSGGGFQRDAVSAIFAGNCHVSFNLNNIAITEWAET